MGGMEEKVHFLSHSIFSGVVETNSSTLHFFNDKVKSGELQQITIDALKDKSSRESMCSLFYDGVIDARYPSNKLGDQYKEIAHFRKEINRLITICDDATKNISYDCFIEHIDYRVFSNEMLIFSITVDNSHLSLNEITSQNRLIRSVKFYNDKFKADYLSLFSTLIELKQECDGIENIDLSHSLFTGNKLYNYLLVRLDEENDKYYSKDTLYDLSCEYTMGGSNDLNDSRCHDPHYKEYLLENNSIVCFASWKGLVLNDTMCVLMNSSEPEMRYNNWKIDYLEFIYMNVFYLKAYLVMMNKKYQNVNATSKLEKEYLEFDRTFNFKNISYNFLPQLIYDRIRVGMEINDELSQLKDKISSYSDKCERENEQTINRILFVMTIFTLTSAINDGVDLWSIQSDGVYRWIKIVLFITSAIAAIYIWIKFFRNRT